MSSGNSPGRPVSGVQSAPAAFTPAFQATIPDLLTKEEDYTRALSLSRLAYDLENLLWPAADPESCCIIVAASPVIIRIDAQPRLRH